MNTSEFMSWYFSLNSDFQQFLEQEYNITCLSNYEDLQKVTNIKNYNGELKEEWVKYFNFNVEKSITPLKNDSNGATQPFFVGDLTIKNLVDFCEKNNIKYDFFNFKYYADVYTFVINNDDKRFGLAMFEFSKKDNPSDFDKLAREKCYILLNPFEIDIHFNIDDALYHIKKTLYDNLSENIKTIQDTLWKIRLYYKNLYL